MEEKKNFLDYLGQVVSIFGITMIAMMLFAMAFGDDTVDISTMFQLGSRGLSISIMVQFLGVSAITVALNYLFLTDAIIKNLSLTLRYIFVQLSIVLVIVALILIFKWFPINMWQPWLMFLICFAISIGASIFITTYKEKVENKKMQEGLDRLKKELKEVQDE